MAKFVTLTLALLLQYPDHVYSIRPSFGPGRIACGDAEGSVPHGSVHQHPTGNVQVQLHGSPTSSPVRLDWFPHHTDSS